MVNTNRTEKSNLTKEVEMEIQTQLLQGHKIKEIAEYHSTTYNVVYGFRRKLVRAGILKGIHTKKRVKNTPKADKTVVTDNKTSATSDNLSLITSKFNSICSATGKSIKKGEIMYYDRNNKKGYHISYLDDKQPVVNETNSVSYTTTFENDSDTFTLVVNNTQVSISDAKFVKVSKGKLEVKY